MESFDRDENAALDVRGRAWNRKLQKCFCVGDVNEMRTTQDHIHAPMLNGRPPISLTVAIYKLSRGPMKQVSFGPSRL